MRFIAVLFTCAVMLITYNAYAEGLVANTLRFEIDSGYSEIKAGNFSWRPISINQDASLEVFVDVKNNHYDDLTAYVCDAEQLNRLRTNQSFRCWGEARAKDNFTISGKISGDQPHYLVFSNTFSMLVKKKASFKIYATIDTPWQLAHEFEKGMSALTSEIANSYGIKEFDVSLAPCGQINAFSHTNTGNITICSELFMETIKSDNKGTLVAVLFHEIGHSLLNLLKLPNWDNEEAVDEFALYSMYQANEQEHAISWIEWNESRFSKAELVNLMNKDARHPLTLQRARNIRRILKSPDEMIQRWSNLLYPHMTNQALQKIVAENNPHADTALAKELLSAR